MSLLWKTPWTNWCIIPWISVFYFKRGTSFLLLVQRAPLWDTYCRKGRRPPGYLSGANPIDGLRFCSPQEALPGGDPGSVKYDHHERGAATGNETAPKGTGSVTVPINKDGDAKAVRNPPGRP